MFILAAAAPQETLSVQNQPIWSSFGVDRRRIQHIRRQQLIYRRQLGIVLIRHRRLFGFIGERKHDSNLVEFRQCRSLRALFAVSELRPVSPSRRWHEQFCGKPCPELRRRRRTLSHLQQRSLLDVLIEFFAILVLRHDFLQIRVSICLGLSASLRRLASASLFQARPRVQMDSESEQRIRLGSQMLPHSRRPSSL